MELDGFEVSATYGGLLAGTREYHSEQLRLELAIEFPTSVANSGFALVLPECDFLPYWECSARLTSSEVFREDDVGSVLKICWFVEDINKPIPELVGDVLGQVDWRMRARSYQASEI